MGAAATLHPLSVCGLKNEHAMINKKESQEKNPVVNLLDTYIN